jgi:hypothetical protein
MLGPAVTLCSVSRAPDGLISLSLAVGRDPERTYCASIDAVGPGYGAASIDNELFFQLSELSLRRYADCSRYHMELCGLLLSIARGETLELPVVLGASSFARPPSFLRWIRNQIRRRFSRRG